MKNTCDSNYQKNQAKIKRMQELVEEMLQVVTKDNPMIRNLLTPLLRSFQVPPDIDVDEVLRMVEEKIDYVKYGND